MSDTLPSPPSDPGDEDAALARQAAAQPGSLLRLRDVQALNRSFRRLAEVQAALLDHLEELEEEKRRSRPWLLPSLALGGMLLGVGLAALAFVWYQSHQQPPSIVVEAPTAPPPSIVVEPTPVTVDAPVDPALRELVGAMGENLTALQEEQRAGREQMAQLTERLLQSEQERMALLARIAEGTPRAEEPAAEAPRAEEAAAPVETPGSGSPDPWLAVVNGLLALDGYPGLRFQKATRVRGEPRLEDVVLLEWGGDGRLRSSVRAGRVEFDLHRMAHTLVMRFYEGSRSLDGARSPLPADGYRIDLPEVDVRAWLEHFPELAEAAELAVAEPPAVVAGAGASGTGNARGAGGDGGAGATGPAAEPAPAVEPRRATPRLSAEAARRVLDGLVSQRGSFSYYRAGHVGEVTPDGLRLVQLNWHDNSGRLVKTIEADSLEIRLHPKGGSVELLLRDGAFLDHGRRSPFSSDRFSLYLPRQDLDAWRASGLPYVEVGA